MNDCDPKVHERCGDSGMIGNFSIGVRNGERKASMIVHDQEGN